MNQDKNYRDPDHSMMTGTLIVLEWFRKKIFANTVIFIM